MLAVTPDSASEAQREALLEKFASTPTEAVRNDLVESFLPLAEFFARRYRDRGVERDDLRQVAKLALVKAGDRFDPTRNVPFAVFAGRTIDGELKRYFRDRTWAVKMPRSLQERSQQVRHATQQLSAELGRAPVPAELVDVTGLDLDQVIEALDASASYHASSIYASASTGSSEGQTLADRLMAPGDAIAKREAQMTVESLLETLPEREQRIVRLRFEDERTQREIAEIIGVSQMHVSRLIRKSLKDLRERYRSATD